MYCLPARSKKRHQLKLKLPLAVVDRRIRQKRPKTGGRKKERICKNRRRPVAGRETSVRQHFFSKKYAWGNEEAGICVLH